MIFLAEEQLQASVSNCLQEMITSEGPLACCPFHGMVTFLGFLFSICLYEKEMNSLGENTTVGHLSTENESNFYKLRMVQISKWSK